MWNLPLPDDKIKQWYIDKLADKVVRKLDNMKDKQQSVYKQILMPNNSRSVIEKLLTDTPQDSFTLCESKMEELLWKLKKDKYTDSNLMKFRAVKAKKKTNRTQIEEQLYNNYSKVISRLHKVFDYKGLISGDASFSYELSKCKQARTCTYCGREYIYTVEDLSAKDKIKQIARPDFDHWMSHDLYPLLALNYCNLIPACPICNRIVKGTNMMKLGVHVHPYINQKEPKFRFSYTLLNIEKPHGEVLIENDNDPQEKNTIDMFQLRALYRYHSETELDDMLRIGLKNGKQYVEDYLMKLLEGLNLTPEEAYRSMFGSELYYNVDQERPLSKFKKDILAELGIVGMFDANFM